MAIDWSFLDAIPGAIPKGPRHCKVIAKVKTARKSRDEAESDKVRERSGGRCEIVVNGVRCRRNGRQVHHRLGGNGQRGRGESALAKHKDHSCDPCHKKITDGDLVHVSGHTYRVRPLAKREK
jgi:hypothetical protein